MIYDTNGTELVYWPISGLISGQDSAILAIRVPTPQPGKALTSTTDTRAVVYARLHGGGPWLDLAAHPQDLSILVGPTTDFDVYIHANADIGPFERIPFTVGVAGLSPADWAG